MRYTERYLRTINIGKFDPRIGAWSYGFLRTMDYPRSEGVRYNIWLFKLKSQPVPGETLNGHIIGINWSFALLFKFRIYH